MACTVGVVSLHLLLNFNDPLLPIGPRKKCTKSLTLLLSLDCEPRCERVYVNMSGEAYQDINLQTLT